MMKKLVSVLLLCALCLGIFASCSDKEEGRMLSFAESQSISEMEKLDGQTVTMIGYMSTLSPISGKFMYLMNLPYQSCPFCVPNTTQLSNTIAVYAKGEFEFTDSAIKVTGILEFGNYTDEFGYEYGYRIKDATYEVLNSEDMSDELRLWQSLAADGAISEVFAMFEYLNFVCNWPTYTANFGNGKDYLYPTDALKFIETDGAQFNYGYKDGYFDSLISRIKAVDPEAFSDLVSIIERAKILANDAYSDLKSGKYDETAEYSNVFRDGRKQYVMDSGEVFSQNMNSLYSEFSTWLSGWEL